MCIFQYLLKKILMKNFYIFILFFSSFVIAKGEGIPFSFISFQLLNFCIFASILIYFAIKKIPNLLEGHYQNYLIMKKRAQQLYEQAYQRKDEIQKKMLQLKQDEKNFESTLKTQITNLEKVLTLETEKQCAITLNIAQNFVDQELIKFKNQIKNNLLEQIEKICVQNCKNQPQNNESFLNKVKNF